MTTSQQNEIDEILKQALNLLARLGEVIGDDDKVSPEVQDFSARAFSVVRELEAEVMIYQADREAQTHQDAI